MRAKILRVSNQFLGDIFLPGKHCYESAENPLPEDTKVDRVFIQTGYPDQIAIVLTSETFEEVENGRIIPEIDPKPMFRRLDT